MQNNYFVKRLSVTACEEKRILYFLFLKIDTKN